MIIFDIETIPNQIDSRQWREFKEKKNIDRDDDAALYPAFGKICCICAYRDTDKQRLKIASTVESDLLEQFAEFSSRETILAGQNIKGFDIPFIAIRAIANNMRVPSIVNCAGKKPWEIPHIDTMELMKFGGNQHISLDAACLIFQIDSPKEGDVNALSVWKAYQAGNLDQIIDYCSADVRATMQIISALRLHGVLK